MRLSRPSLFPVCPCLALAMSLLLLAGLAGCGSASSENAPPRTDLLASAASSATASPAPLASENKTSSVSARGSVPVEDSPKAAPASSTTPANPMDSLVIPDGIAKDLASTNVDTRLRALETSVLNVPVGSIDPLILALGDDDERVRERAKELIKQDWTRAGVAGQ